MQCRLKFEQNVLIISKEYVERVKKLWHLHLIKNHAFHGCGSMKGNSFLGQTGESGIEFEIIILCTFCIWDQGWIGHIHTLFLFQDLS